MMLLLLLLLAVAACCAAATARAVVALLLLAGCPCSGSDDGDDGVFDGVDVGYLALFCTCTTVYGCCMYCSVVPYGTAIDFWYHCRCRTACCHWSSFWHLLLPLPASPRPVCARLLAGAHRCRGAHPALRILTDATNAGPSFSFAPPPYNRSTPSPSHIPKYSRESLTSCRLRMRHRWRRCPAKMMSPLSSAARTTRSVPTTLLLVGMRSRRGTGGLGGRERGRTNAKAKGVGGWGYALARY